MSPAPTAVVRFAEHGNGPRHLRLRAIWRAIAACEPQVRIEPQADRGGHRQFLEAATLIPATAPILLLTEEDFLPNLDSDWCSAEHTLSGAHLVACSYRMRGAFRMLDNDRGIVGGWYLAFNTHLDDLSSLDFSGPDPGNRLQNQIAPQRLILMPGEDGYPAHYGIEYPVGVHLFWSRHLHDPPERRVSGISLGDVQAKHDARVDRWIARAPQRFREVYKEPA